MLLGSCVSLTCGRDRFADLPVLVPLQSAPPSKAPPVLQHPPHSPTPSSSAAGKNVAWDPSSVRSWGMHDRLGEC